MRSPIKWAGGKTSMLEELRPLILDRLSGWYVEPFIGGGAVALSMRTPLVVVGDATPEVAEMWLMVQQRPRQLYQKLYELQFLHTKEFYYEVRATVPTDATERVARFIYLNKMGFNGLFRKNKSGQFNVPLGRGRLTSIPTLEELTALSAIVATWSIHHLDFEPLIEVAEPGDCIYADPPYDGTHDYSSSFGDCDRARLSSSLRRAARRGVGVIVTDADTPRTRELYNWMDVRFTAERRRISSDGNRDTAACLIGVRP